MFDEIKRAGMPLALSLSLLSGCSFSDGARSEYAEKPAATSYDDIGGGVYVIKGGLSGEYEQNLSKFCKDHPELEIETNTPQDGRMLWTGSVITTRSVAPK